MHSSQTLFLLLVVIIICHVFAQRQNRYCYGIRPRRIKGRNTFLSRQIHRTCDRTNLKYYRSHDGLCTHPGRPFAGASKTPLFSYFGTSFDARNMGGQGLPSARKISNEVFHQNSESIVDNEHKHSEFVTFFGQFLDHSIVATSNDATEVQNIPVPNDDQKCELKFIKFNRNTKANSKGVKNGPGWNRAVNVLTSAIDLFGVYGGDALSRNLRTGSGGLLRTSGGVKNLLPLNNGGINKVDAGMNAPKTSAAQRKKFFIAGDFRSNENPQLTALHTLFMRMHNEIAIDLASQFKGVSDEWLYQSARRVCQAYFQSVVYNEYLPVMLGEKLEECPRTADGRQCFRQDEQIGISDIFSIAAFRVGHTMVGNFVHMRDARGRDFKKLNLADSFFHDSSLIQKYGIEPFIRGAIWNQAQKIDRFIVEALRNELFENVDGEEGFDLAAINIQRGRDSNLPTFAEVKKRFLGITVTSFQQITRDKKVEDCLCRVYSGPKEVELWVGLLCEDHAKGKPMGPTLIEIWKREFLRLRNGDYYFYQNKNIYETRLLSYKPLSDVIEGRGLKMRDLIIKYSNIKSSELPADIWRVR